jgi:hypothetical protein
MLIYPGYRYIQYQIKLFASDWDIIIVSSMNHKGWALTVLSGPTKVPRRNAFAQAEKLRREPAIIGTI